MTLQNQGRRWRVCLFLTAAASVKSQLRLDSYHGVSGGGQPRKAPLISSCRGGGSRSSFPREQQPPPPPPRPPPVSKKKEKRQQQQQGRFWSGHFIPPPPQQPSGELSHAPQRNGNDLPLENIASPKLASPPSHLDSESHHAAWRPPPPPPLPRTFPNHVRNRDPSQRQPAPPASRPGNASQQVQQSTIKRTPESATAHDPASLLLPDGGSAYVGDRRSGPFVPLPNDGGGVFVGDAQNAPFVPRPHNGSASAGDKWSSPSSMDTYYPTGKHLDTDIQTVFPRQDFRALATADFILVSPENVDPLDRISLKTGIRPKQDRRDATLGSLVHLHHELVLEQLLQSQESVREEMVAITQLLRALLAVQVRHDSLVLHVPRHLAPRITRRRRVEKRRTIPRRTILSTLENLDRDLSDGEFNVLLHGLMQPSEVEEVYHEYEYDQEDVLPQELHPPIHITPNQDEFNEFLRETSDSETAEQYYEQDQYDSDFSYDYYNDEPLDEMWDEDSLTDMAVGGLTRDQILLTDKEDVAMSVRDPESAFSFEVASRENHVPNDDVCEEAPETSSRLNESSAANGPKDSIMRASTSASRRPPPPPPPPPRHHSTKGHSHWRSDQTRIRPPVHCTLPTGSGVRTADEGLKKPLPPPPPPRVPPDRYCMTPLPPISKLSLEVVYEPEESAWSDQSDDLDQDEVRLLEDTAINEIDDQMRNEEEEDYEDSIDEDDFRILQLSRWTPSDGGKKSRWAPFVGRKKQSFDDDEEEDIFVDEAVYLDGALYDAMTTDDFTDIEGETPSLPASLVEDKESSEDEMILGEPAVTDIPGYTENHFGGPKLNLNAPHAHHGNAHLRLLQPPPPPRPPPRHVSVHNASKMHSAIKQPHVQQAVQPQLARPTGQSTLFEVCPPCSSQEHELYDRLISRAPASHSSHGTGYPDTHTNPLLHNARDTRRPNGDAEKSQYKR